jgi:outer membrane biosynthesis protein TonB
MDVSMHGDTYAQFANNKEYDVTGNSYPKNGDLSADGIKQMYKLGQDFKKEYVDKQKFMSSSFDPNSVFLQSIKDQPGLMSAYAFMLGAYPDSTGYLNLKMDNALEHQKLVRKTVGLSETPSRGTQSVSVATDEGFLYWTNPAKQCPALYKKIQAHLSSGGEALDSEYQAKLYPQLAAQFSKPASKFTFASTHYYLDDYLVAQRTGSKYPQFSNQKNIDKLIEEYERDYYYEGILGGNEISRVVATPLINYLLINNFAQGEVARGTLKDPKLAALKHSHFFTNEVGFAAFLKAIGYPQGSAPKGAQNIRFELFKTNGRYFVRSTLDGNPLNFVSSEHGIFELDEFLKTIFPMMYFGDITQVCAGKEDISLNVYPKCQNYQDYLMQYFAEITHVDHKVVKKCHLAEKVVPVPVRRPERTVEHKVDLINVGFVEIVQVAPPQRCRVDTKVIERAVPVIEEKVVVHEVEKVIAEPPTHIHHIVIDTPDKPTGIPATFLEEETPAGWPWWLWLIPLLCYIPCLALLCCRKKKPAPAARPKQPMAPVVAKPLAKPKEKQIMHVKTEERHSPERKFVIEKKVVDEAEDIEMEITKELQKSRVIRESRQAQAVSHGRQTAAEIAAESQMMRGSGGGRRIRRKVIKKFGQTIGEEIQYLDEDGNVTRTERVGMDENEARSDHHMAADIGLGQTEVYARTENQHIAGSAADHVFNETYERETRQIGPEPTSSLAYGQNVRSRRGYSSGRHIESAAYSSGGGLGSGSAVGGFGAGSAGGGGLIEGDMEYGRYSPGGRRLSRASRGSGGRDIGTRGIGSNARNRGYFEQEDDSDAF